MNADRNNDKTSISLLFLSLQPRVWVDGGFWVDGVFLVDGGFETTVSKVTILGK